MNQIENLFLTLIWHSKTAADEGPMICPSDIFFLNIAKVANILVIM